MSRPSTSTVNDFSRARAAVVGVGALGCQVAYGLARAGVAELLLIDDDRVDRTNLGRQILFSPADVGRPKAGAAAEALRSLAPPACLVPVEARLESGNATSLLQGRDLVVDATDDPRSKFLLNRMCVALNVPLVHGGVAGTAGVAFAVLPSRTACVACAFDPSAEGPSRGCAELGVLAPVAGVIGALQTILALRILAGHATAAGTLHAYDLRARRWRTLRIPRDRACAVCGNPEHAANSWRRTECRS